ncbi:hypothetical protein OE88DRAFT_1659396 [Heliocybe sulcata]|uniref:Uncharacterized protein n=1 Tax=Heliocybe sulcata TaxID=5364 RepID=A0A5C3N2A4_9AGAM|nr:hypothetical protein OE88DRAFT_1659396 [Heliocybe sulcata]
MFSCYQTDSYQAHRLQWTMHCQRVISSLTKAPVTSANPAKYQREMAIPNSTVTANAEPRSIRALLSYASKVRESISRPQSR